MRGHGGVAEGFEARRRSLPVGGVGEIEDEEALGVGRAARAGAALRVNSRW